MAPPTLYHVPKTISSPIFQILMELNLVDNPVHVATLSFPELKSDSHLAVNPMGTSPAFRDADQGIVMWESAAVLTYLLETYDTSFRFHPRLATADDDAEIRRIRAKFLQLQQYILATVYPFIASLYVHVITKPLEEQDADYVESAKQKWKTLLGPTLTKGLGDADYLLGSYPSAVDFLVAKPLNNVQSMEMLSEFPALERLFHRISKLPSFAKAYDLTTTPARISATTAERQRQQQLVLVINPVIR